MALRLAVLVLFFLSGACGLVYEVVWMRMLTVIFGATAFATSTILAAFFTGLALGGAIFGRIIDRGRSPLKVYAVLEGGIGLFAFLMPLLLSGVTGLYVGIARQLGLGFSGTSLVIFVLSFLVLVIPATLMGGTLPVMVKFFARREEEVGLRVGQLYALNTLGAVVGTMAAGFFLILMLGVREAAYAAGAVNLAIAGTVFLVARALKDEDTAPAPEETEGAGGSAREAGRAEEEGEAEEDGGRAAASPRTVRLALWAMGVGGFCALALEVFWTRALVFFLDNSTHAFTTILTAFLLGIGIGSLFIAPFLDRGRRLLGWLGVLEILIGISAILALPVLNALPSVFERMADAPLDGALRWKWMGARFLNTLPVVLVPTTLMGMAFPLAARIYTTSLGRMGTSLGTIYAVNTLAGVVGSLLAGFLLIPLVGVQNGILLVAGVNLLMGVILVVNEPGMGGTFRWTTGAAAVLAFMALGALPRGGDTAMLSSYYEELETDRVLHYEEGTGGTVKVYRDVYGDRIISVNGFPVAGEPPEYQDAQKALAHFPLLLSPVESPRVAIVGFGAGGTSWGVMQHDVAFVHCIELVSAVPRAAVWFPEVNHGVLDLSGYELILNDGRNHIQVTDQEYDIISVDATSPKMAGNGSLYTRDFYEVMRERLSEDGIAVQWIPYHLLSDGEVRMTIASFQSVFPHTSLWFSPLRQNATLIGTMRELSIDYQGLVEDFRDEGIRSELRYVNVGDPLGLLATFIMGEEALRGYVGTMRDNTDNHPYLEFTPALAYFVGDLYRLRNLLDFREARESVLPWLVNTGGTEEEREAVREAVLRREEAVAHSIDGDVFLVLGERERAMEKYEEALAVDPGEMNWLNSPARLERR